MKASRVTWAHFTFWTTWFSPSPPQTCGGEGWGGEVSGSPLPLHEAPSLQPSPAERERENGRQRRCDGERVHGFNAQNSFSGNSLPASRDERTSTNHFKRLCQKARCARVTSALVAFLLAVVQAGADPTTELVFVGSGRKNIEAFRLDLASGALTRVGLAAEIEHPSFL